MTGFPLGIFEEATYDERTLILDKGDIIVFYSDGVGDAQNRSGEFFGAARVAKLVNENPGLSPDGLADRHSRRRRTRFSGGQHPSDDRTLVVLKVAT